ncbi:MAG: tetratricopeptide repeat protein [Rhodospirillaceae bacterium]|nr:tetratricopeptide repeat protein [Rhodospirillaceae bacterium]
MGLPEQFNEAFRHHAAGRLSAAEALYRAILAADIRHAGALHGLGLMALQTGRPEIAVRLIGEALAVDAGNADHHADYGLALMQAGRTDDAIAAQGRAAGLAPREARHHFNLGRSLQSAARLDEAEACYRKAIALMPDVAAFHGNLGLVLLRRGDLAGAVDELRRGVSLAPDDAMVHASLGAALLEQGDAAAAVARFERAIQLQPDFPEAGGNLIFALNFTTADLAHQQAQRKAWNSRAPAVARLPARTPQARAKIRVGYVSKYFRHQAAAYAFAPVILYHDRKRFEVICYSDTTAEDGVTALLKDAATAWRDTTGMSDAALAGQVRADGIDILVDCVGHMQGNRLGAFAYKPAPIQVTAWGEPTGTGLAAMDYLLADPVLVPKDSRRLFAEKVADLPCFLGYWSPEELPPPGPPPALANGHVTFASFNRATKITPATVRLWAAVLHRLPTSRLLLKFTAYGGAQDRTRLAAAFSAQGIAADRIDFMDGTGRAAHFAAYRRADICLDPTPHGGGMTTLDALWMGVPVVTVMKETPSSRLAGAALSALGLEDWIAADAEDYAAKAGTLAADPQRLAEIRAGLRARMAATPVGDPEAYALAVEKAYEGMFADWLGGK